MPPIRLPGCGCGCIPPAPPIEFMFMPGIADIPPIDANAPMPCIGTVPWPCGWGTARMPVCVSGVLPSADGPEDSGLAAAPLGALGPGAPPPTDEGADDEAEMPGGGGAPPGCCCECCGPPTPCPAPGMGVGPARGVLLACEGGRWGCDCGRVGCITGVPIRTSFPGGEPCCCCCCCCC